MTIMLPTFADYERRFLGAMALLYPPETHVRW
jgi:hypothetical protein